MLASVYTFNTEKIRIRIKTFEAYAVPISLPESIDMDNDEQFMGVDLWDAYANFEAVSFWSKLSTSPKHTTRALIANALCTKMDLASAVYNSPTKSIEIFGLEHFKAYSYFDREEQLDWKFVGYATMASGKASEAAEQVVVGSKDLFEEHVGGEEFSCTKVFREFQYSAVSMVTFVSLNVRREMVEELFERCEALKVIRAVNKRRVDYWRDAELDDAMRY